MTKTSAEEAVRDAAAVLYDKICKAREEGLVVTWPGRAEGLAGISISETGKPRVEVIVHADAAAPEVIQKATAAAQSAADRTVAKAADTAAKADAAPAKEKPADK